MTERVPIVHELGRITLYVGRNGPMLGVFARVSVRPELIGTKLDDVLIQMQNDLGDVMTKAGFDGYAALAALEKVQKAEGVRP
ncbi:MAG: hypothetical protein WC683_11755 [bacterium]